MVCKLVENSDAIIRLTLLPRFIFTHEYLERAQNKYAAKNRGIDNILRQNKEWAKSKIKLSGFTKKSSF